MVARPLFPVKLCYRAPGASPTGHRGYRALVPTGAEKRSAPRFAFGLSRSAHVERRRPAGCVIGNLPPHAFRGRPKPTSSTPGAASPQALPPISGWCPSSPTDSPPAPPCRTSRLPRSNEFQAGDHPLHNSAPASPLKRRAAPQACSKRCKPRPGPARNCSARFSRANQPGRTVLRSGARQAVAPEPPGATRRGNPAHPGAHLRTNLRRISAASWLGALAPSFRVAW